MTLGARGLADLVLKTGWDATELEKFKLADGTTIMAVYDALNSALGALNIELASGVWAAMTSFTDQPEISYRVGTSNGMVKHSEWTPPDPARAETEGHMLPVIGWDRGLGWSYDYLKDARMEDIDADIADAIKDARDRWRLQHLTRVLQRGDDSGTNKGLGSAGYSPGFATTAAQTSVDFVPPAFGGNEFDNTHEHYLAIAGGVYTNAVFEDAYDELREHGHEPPFEFLISSSDRTTVEGLSKFTPVTPADVQRGSTQDVATVNSMDYLGVIETFRVREVFGMPQYYGFGYKSYGPGSRRNPLRTRLERGYTTPTAYAMQDPRNGSGAHPLQFMMVYIEFGVGVYDRTAGTPRYNNGGAWTDGTPT